MVAQAPGVTTSHRQRRRHPDRQPGRLPRPRRRPAPEHLHPERRERHRQHQQRRLAVLLRRRLLRGDAGRDQLAQRRGADPGHAPEHRPEVGHEPLPRHGQRSTTATISIQSDNVDDELRARGVNRASNLHQYLDAGFDVGGPILRDRSGSGARIGTRKSRTSSPARRNPDGSFPIDRTYLWYPSGKINWKPAKSHNLSGYFNMAQKKRFKRSLSALRPVETTHDQQGAPIARLFTLRDDWTVGTNMLVSLKLNIMDQGFELKAAARRGRRRTRRHGSMQRPASGPTRRRTSSASARTSARLGGTVTYFVGNLARRPARLQVRVRYQPLPRPSATRAAVWRRPPIRPIIG